MRNSNNLLQSTLFYEENSSWRVLSKINNRNITDSNFKENMYSFVKNEALFLKKNISYENIRTIDNILEALPEKLFERLSREKYYEESTLSLFYHLSSLKSAKRSLEQKKNDCDCGFYADSFEEKTPFFCEEDRLVNTINAFNVIKDLTENTKFAGKTFAAEKTLKYLESNKGKYLSISKIDRLVKDEFVSFLENKLTQKELQSILPKNQSVNLKSLRFNTLANSENDTVLLPYDMSCLVYGAASGGDCGCCSNYSGPCYFCTLACYLHDLACQDCGWGCGWRCVLGPCKN